MTFKLSEKPIKFNPQSPSYILVKSKSDVLVNGVDGSVFFDITALKLSQQDHNSLLYIGELKGKALYALESDSAKDLLVSNEQGYKQCRHIMDLLSQPELTAFYRAAYLLNWDRVSKFCGCCGKETHLSEEEFVKRCPGCHHLHFPQYSPAINVLVIKENHLLLGRSPQFEKGMYSPLAGFIEAGETPIEAVHRELWEEVKVKVENVQISNIIAGAWPFPNTILLGFLADYKEGLLDPNKKEVEDAQWFHYSRLPKLPIKSSISYQLIEEGIKRCKEFDEQRKTPPKSPPQNTTPKSPNIYSKGENASTTLSTTLDAVKNFFKKTYPISLNSPQSMLPKGTLSFGMKPWISLSKSPLNPHFASLTWLAKNRNRPIYLAGACLTAGLGVGASITFGMINHKWKPQK